ncbi:VanZ family protein [Desulfovibrio inopinatus]|uniref:VanZ family protein n=1 Tax=Desulfovibrio inopinatus TaxID=102109 RepID=UPI000418CF84|nr:VanZ family protein [Desulfovibrio inopinatus]
MIVFLKRWGALLLIVFTAAVTLSTFVPAFGHVEHDKIGHALVFGGMCFLVPFVFKPRKGVLLASGAIVGLSGVLEFLQSFVPERTASLDDMAANIIGATLGLFAALLIKNFFASSDDDTQRIERL